MKAISWDNNPIKCALSSLKKKDKSLVQNKNRAFTPARRCRRSSKGSCFEGNGYAGKLKSQKSILQVGQKRSLECSKIR
jgi:hypothetical protein